MMTRHATVFPGGCNVVPYVRVAAGKAMLLELAYEWAGVKGTVPQVSVDLSADLKFEKVFIVGVYQNAVGERKVAVDSKVIDTSKSIPVQASESADAILEFQGWSRCFLIFQVFVPPGLTGVVEEENTVTHVFEHTSRPANA